MKQFDQIFNIPDDVQDLENILRDDDLNILLAHKKLYIHHQTICFTIYRFRLPKFYI